MDKLLQIRNNANLPKQEWLFFLAWLLLVVSGPVFGGTLDAVLNPDGTVRAGVRGSFSAAGYSLETRTDGELVFRAGQAKPVDFLAPAAILGNGVNNTVYALAADGNGNLYAGGSFTTAGGVSASRVAKWDGTTWTPLGTGMNDNVEALAVDASGNLYAGGSFTTAGGVSASRVAKWDGTAWSALGGGMNNTVHTLLLSPAGNLYAGGDFTTAGGVAATALARWSGTGWSAIGLGLAGGGVYALAFDTGGNLYAGGTFLAVRALVNNIVSTVFTYYVAKWNGTAWSALGNGMDRFVYALAADAGGNLYAGGWFTSAGTASVSYVARWNGANWSGLGTGVNNYVNALAVDASGSLYAGGSFATASGQVASNVAKWTGGNWAPLGLGVNSTVWALTYASGSLYAGGFFSTAGGQTANKVARWSGTAWSALESGPTLTAYHLAQSNNPIIRTNLNYQTSGVVKVGADNSAGTLLNLARGVGQNFTLRLRENPANTSTGTLADNIGYLGAPVTTTAAVEVVYHHPSVVDAIGSHKDLHLELIDNATTVVLGTYLIQVVRPPLLLVHGLWSNGQDAFPNLRTYLVTNGLYDREDDIRYAKYTNDRDFAFNAPAIINDKNALLKFYADRNISVSKIDIIGHSMGGLLPRQYIQGPDYQNDVNKLITLNTPHSGSPIPNFINALHPLDRAALTSALTYLGMDPTKGAVADLNYSAPTAGIARLNAAPNTHGVALHTVTTNITLNSTLTLDQLANGAFSWPGAIVSFMAFISPRASRNINGFLVNDLFRNSNDLIVGLDSQQGGLVTPFTDNTTGQMHIASAANPAVQIKLAALLRENSHNAAASNSFTTVGFRPAQITSYYPRQAPTPTPSAQTTSTLLITSPTRSTVVTDRDSIQVAVSASSDVTRIMLVCGTGTAELTTKLITGAGGSAYIRVPRHGLGRLKIAAFAFADSTYVQYDTLGTRLTTNATLTGLRLEPRFVYTTLGDSAIVQVTGTYSDGIDRNVLGQPGMQFTFRTGGKARMGRSKGYVIGINTGRDSLRVTYAGRTDIVPLEIAVPQAPVLATHVPVSKQQLAVWPNPAQQSVQVSGASGGRIELLDLLGRVVRTHATVNSSEEVTLDLRNLPTGVYIVRAGTATRRLLVE